MTATFALGEPMLARLVRDLPVEGHLYEPKWDGFRCLAACEGAEVDLRSRNRRPFARYFPEVVEALAAVDADGFAVDGELLARDRDGRFDFAALLSRLHPAASRVERLRRETPATFVAFDVLRVGGRDVRDRPFLTRRAALEQLLGGAGPPLAITPITENVETARSWLEGWPGGGVDGVVAKPRALRYRPGERAMLKIKRERTAECVVAGVRWMLDRPGRLGSLLLGLYDAAGSLRHVGVVSSFTEAVREERLRDLLPLAIPLEEHPWREGFLIDPSPLGRLKGAAGRWTPDMVMDWVPLQPVRVCEVAYERFDRDRFRHPARFVRWRPDRDPRSCTFEQLAPPSDPEAVPA